MTARNRCGLLALLLLVGCGGAVGSEGFDDGDSSSKGGSQGEPGSGSGGSPPASVDPGSGDCGDMQITPLSEANGLRVVAGPNRMVTVRVQRSNLDDIEADDLDSWDWLIVHGTEVVVAKSGGASECTFPVPERGVYTVTATNQSSCKVSLTLRAIAPEERHIDLWMRVTPLAKDLVPHEQLVPVAIDGPGQVNIALKQGLPVTIAPRRASASGALEVPSFIRVLARASTFRWEGHTRGSSASFGLFQAQLDPFLLYDVLIAPEDGFAPVLLKGQMAEDLLVRILNLEPGSEIRGNVMAEGAPLAGARVLLRTSELPSTLGTSNSSGEFKVFASAGRYGVIVRPPTDSSLPDLALPEKPGLDVAAARTNAQIRFLPLPTGDLTVRVLAPNGSAALADVAVELATAAPLGEAGSIEFGGVAPLPLEGTVVRHAVTDARGEVRFAGIPRTTYTLRLVPPRSPALAQTQATVALAQSEQAVVVQIAAPVPVSGTLQPPEGSEASVEGTIVAAYEATSAATPPKTAPVDAQGRFSLPLDPQRSYRLRVVPPLASGLPVTPLATVHVGAEAIALPTRRLPRGRTLQGSVTDPRGGSLPGAMVQIYCVGEGDDCFTRSGDGSAWSVLTAIPFAEVLTDASGSYRLNVIDPASL